MEAFRQQQRAGAEEDLAAVVEQLHAGRALEHQVEIVDRQRVFFLRHQPDLRVDRQRGLLRDTVDDDEIDVETAAEDVQVVGERQQVAADLGLETEAVGGR